MKMMGRMLFGVPGAALLTLLLFLLLAGLIRQTTEVQLSEDRSVSINVTRQLEETSVQQQTDFQRPVLDSPPPPPPAVHDASFRPTVSGQIGELPDFSGTQLDIGTGFNPDRDAQPMVRIPPQYPDMCQARAASRESVNLEFDVTPDGSVVNVQVVGSTNTCFNRAATRAVERWKYQPRIVGGEAQARHGVRTQITFDLGE
jgi:protein TonB